MTEIRFSYNPFTKHFIENGLSHSASIYREGKQKQFDEYIRGIILDGVLYLRTYYPFEDLTDLTHVALKLQSHKLLNSYLSDILELIKNYEINGIKFNVENDLLSGIGLANI